MRNTECFYFIAALSGPHPSVGVIGVIQVKADRNNKKLYTLQQASRHVNDMAAVVVTSTKQGQQQISDHGERRICLI